MYHWSQSLSVTTSYLLEHASHALDVEAVGIKVTLVLSMYVLVAISMVQSQQYVAKCNNLLSETMCIYVFLNNLPFQNAC